MKRSWRALAVLAVVGAVTTLLPVRGAVAVGTDWKITRLAGADRYETAALASRYGFPDGADEVVVASGEAFADALAATPVAARRGAPLLLTGAGTLPQATIEELRRLTPDRITLVGGTAAVSGGVAFALGTIAPVNRIAGRDRFDTAARLSAETFGTGAPVAFVAQGRAFPDALAAGVTAGSLEGPVLLVERDRVPAAVEAELDRLRPKRLVLVGGTAAIGGGPAATLGAGRTLERIAGANRYATAGALARAVPSPRPVAFIASGLSFADALSAGPSAVAVGGTLSLTDNRCLPTGVAQDFADRRVEELVVVGGRVALPDRAAQSCGPVATGETAVAEPSTTTSSTTTSSTTTSSTTTSSTTTSSTTTPSTVAPTTTTTARLGDGDEGSTPSAPALTATGGLTVDSPDPALLRDGDTWYAYSTQVMFTNLPVRSSDDLVTWSPAKNAIPIDNIARWAEPGFHWAPSVVKTDDDYVMWYSARVRGSDELQCVSRAVSDSPTGPFVDMLGEAPVCQEVLGGSIDPYVFTDEDGSRWLYWKSDENAIGRDARLWVSPLTPDARTLTGPAKAVLARDGSWEEPTIEQPSVVRHGSTYVLFYSGGWWASDTYGIGYATSSSPTGPFSKQTRISPWVQSRTGARGPGALDVFVGPNNALYAAYHAWNAKPGYREGSDPFHLESMRSTRFARLRL